MEIDMVELIQFSDLIWFSLFAHGDKGQFRSLSKKPFNKFLTQRKESRYIQQMPHSFGKKLRCLKMCVRIAGFHNKE